ncbi:MAG: HD domain-containing protein [Methanosarcinales archaeon]|nr:HD domain-containing protein [Methanosarcinales archaeon]
MNIQDNNPIVEAFNFAYNAHKNTHRKSSTRPYIVRPLDVASTLMKNNAPEHVVIVGLLHDVVEDEDYTLSDIRDKFGNEVATLVDGASGPEELIKAERGKSKTWPERKAHTIDFIKNADRDLEAALLCRQISQYPGYRQGL